MVDGVYDSDPKKNPNAKKYDTLSYMDVLDGLDTSGAEPMSHIVPLKNVLREDETAPSMDRGELLKNAPATDGGTFLVPKAVE